jgi:hypothetical protein
LATLDPDKLEALIKKCLDDFHERRIKMLEKLNLRKVLRRKNPYLFKALGTEQAAEIVKKLLEAYVSSSDETIFGNVYFEKIASNLPRVTVATGKGIDLEINEEKVIHEYALKSGANALNASQKEKMNIEFLELKSRLMKMQKQFDPVLAYAYGRKNNPSSGKYIYRESSGQEFWKEVTGDDQFYLKLITLMKDEPLKRIDRYQHDWDATINKFTKEFMEDFCFSSGHIDWEKLTKFVSASEPLKLPPRRKQTKTTEKADKST